MARYLGPKHTLCRKFGIKLCDSPKCPAIRRPYKHGQHGPKGTSRTSEYGTQLAEKQKARMLYGLLERQFRNYVKKATGQTGNSGENLIKLLERRLDNIMYRAGIAQTRRMARQLVSHGHVRVNGKKVSIPSYICRAGETIQLKPRAENMGFIKDAKKGLSKKIIPSWIHIASSEPITIEITGDPSETDVLGVGINTSLIIE